MRQKSSINKFFITSFAAAKGGLFLKKGDKTKKLLLFAGLISLIIFIAVAVVLFLLRYKALWVWYDDIIEMLMALEDKIAALDYSFEFIGAIMILYIIKSFVPIYTTSTLCFLAGAVLPMYIAIPVNIAGFTLQITIKYLWGRRFGAGYAWKLLKKNDFLRKAFQHNGRGNPMLLVAFRALPAIPVNTVSSIYGSFHFGFKKFLLYSAAGFLPKVILLSFTGSNMFDPLSPGFLIPIMIIALLTSISCLGVNGVWNTVDRVIALYDKKHPKESGEPGEPIEEVIFEGE